MFEGKVAVSRDVHDANMVCAKEYLPGSEIFFSLLQPKNNPAFLYLRPVKYLNSSKDVILLFPAKTVLMEPLSEGPSYLLIYNSVFYGRIDLGCPDTLMSQNMLYDRQAHTLTQ